MARRKYPTLEEVFMEAGLIPEWIERGRAQGMIQGMECGRVQGMEQGLEQVARNALAQGVSPELVHTITGLDIEAINSIQLSQ
jgi:predicted transposase YdaD